MKRWYDGSCHCGAIKFRAAIDLEAGTSKCNCTFCWKQRNWNVGSLAPADFKLLAGGETLSTYGRRTEDFDISHFFCSKCGTQTHGRGYLEEMGGDFVSVRVAAIDERPVDQLASAPVTYCDGLNDQWWSPPADTRFL